MSEFAPIVVEITRDDGTVRRYDGDSRWGIVSITGLEFPEAEVFTQPKGLGDGDIITGRRLGGRTVEIHLRPRSYYSRNITDIFTNRINAPLFYTRGRTFTVKFSNYGDVGQMTTPSRVGQLSNAVLTAASYPVLQAGGAQEDLVLQFFSGEPFFEAPEVTEDTVYFQDPDWDERTHLLYTGDLPTPFVLSATVTGGTLYNHVWFTFMQAGSSLTESFLFEKADASNFAVGDVLTLDTSNGMFTINGVATPVDPGEVEAIMDHWKITTGSNAFGGSSIGMELETTISYRGRYYFI